MALLRLRLVQSMAILAFSFLSFARRANALTRPTILTDHLAPRTTLQSHSILNRRSWVLFSTASPESTKPGVPITLLSGFLGTGKTSALQHLLLNQENLKIGVVVNDMADVNIDAKLVAGSSADMIELQNGCACCSLADELFVSIDQLLKGRDLDAIVVELSGVADPMAIQSNWKMAPESVRAKADIERVVTLVDANTFGTDYMTWDAARNRPGWVDPGDDCAGDRKVAELLAEQVEAAHLILVNKIDLATPDEIKIASSVARALNEKAEMKQVEFGRVQPKDLIATVNSVKEVACIDPDCTDASHEHAHSHDHACEDVDCTDSSHSHGHDHATDCADSACTDASHSHSHDHASDCSDPECTDASHSHSHDHATSATSTSMDQLGITSFVYRASVPFHTPKLMNILQQWPVPVKNTLDLGLLQEATEEGYSVGGKHVADSPFVGVLRSKGFCWFAPAKWSGANEDPWRHDTAMYWSHAGKHFSITSAGKCWGTINKEQMKNYFTTNMAEYERILREDFVSDEWGDRRQEIVFIGTGIDKDKITAALDACRLNEKEMKVYRQKLNNYLNTLMTTSAGSGGLFDVGGVDHLDSDDQ